MTVAYLGSPTQQTINTGSKTMTLAVPALAAGRTLIVAMAASATPTAAVPTVNGDAAGWTIDSHAELLQQSTACLYSLTAKNAIPAGNVTLGFSQYLLRWSVFGLLFNGLLTASSPADTQGTGNGTNASPIATGTGPTSQGAELIVGAFATAGGASYIPGANFSAGPFQATTNGTADKSLFAEYRVATVTGVKIADAALDVARIWVAAMATYKAVIAPPPAASSMFFARDGALHPLVIQYAKGGVLV